MTALWLWLPITLGALFAAPLVFSRLRKVWFTASVSILSLDWIAGRIPVAAFNQLDQWMVNALIDFGAMWLFILAGWRINSGRSVLVYLAGSFFFEVMVHCSYGANKILHDADYAAQLAYYWITFILAWGQVLFLCYRGVKSGGKRRRRSRADHCGDNSTLTVSGTCFRIR